jgi:hypothetical protein
MISIEPANDDGNVLAATQHLGQSPAAEGLEDHSHTARAALHRCLAANGRSGSEADNGVSRDGTASLDAPRSQVPAFPRQD